ncbi:MAG: T9SS type A sorting domain-containing protein [Ignavibacteria bacterium]
MKKIILITVVIFSLSGQLMSWDTTAAKYLPLQVGNVWVYKCMSMGYLYQNRYFSRYKITGVNDTLGHRYYVFNWSIVWITNQNGTACSQIYDMKLRIDSSSMNIYTAWAYCGSPEFLVDSLRARLGDTAKTCQSYNFYSVCTDTTPYSIFNSSFPSKRFVRFQGPVIYNVYAKDIGVAYWSIGYGMNSCQDSLKGCVINGMLRGDTSMIVGLQNIGTEIPSEFKLYQNYPNPFNVVTSFKFQITSLGFARLIVYDVLGREVAVLVNEELKPGTYEVDFDGTNYPSGVYYYRLEAGDYTETRKMALVK